MSLINDALRKAEREQREKVVLPHARPVNHSVQPKLREFVERMDEETTAVIEAKSLQAVTKNIWKMLLQKRWITYSSIGVMVTLFILINGFMLYRLIHQQSPFHESADSAMSASVKEQQLRDVRSYEPELSWSARIQRFFSFARSVYVCSGIVRDAEAPIAIINGIVVEEGDRVGGALVQEIRDTEVHLVKKNKVLVIPLSL